MATTSGPQIVHRISPKFAASFGCNNPFNTDESLFGKLNIVGNSSMPVLTQSLSSASARPSVRGRPRKTVLPVHRTPHANWKWEFSAVIYLLQTFSLYSFFLYVWLHINATQLLCIFNRVYNWSVSPIVYTLFCIHKKYNCMLFHNIVQPQLFHPIYIHDRAF